MRSPADIQEAARGLIEIPPRVIEVEGLRPIVVYPREAVLEMEHVAAAFGIGERSAERQHFPCFYLGTRTRRFLWGTVLDHCARKSA